MYPPGPHISCTATAVPEQKSCCLPCPNASQTYSTGFLVINEQGGVGTREESFKTWGINVTVPTETTSSISPSNTENWAGESNSGDKDLGCAGHESKLCCTPALHIPQKAPGERAAAATIATAPWEVLCHSAVPGTQVQMSAAERRWPHSNTILQYILKEN